ncbi:MAG: hypothetical protein JXR86_03610 [Spirochaetales bacterium]|nr:hypothetical protein [Spirochaetales bacterium]
MAEVKGLVTRLSQVRPYSRAYILSLLQEIDGKRSRLSAAEQTVLDSELEKYLPDDTTLSLLNIIDQGKINFNAEENSPYPMAFGSIFDFEMRSDLNAGNFHSTNMMEWFMQGDILSFLSYDIRLGVGVNNIHSDAFAPYEYTKVADGYYISTGGLDGGGLKDGDDDGRSFNVLLNPELSTAFLDNSINIKLHRHRREMGNGDGNLTLSKTARPYNGLDLDFRPSKWFSFHYSTGSLEDWFAGAIRQADTNDNNVLEDDEMIAQSMFTTQFFELMPFDWFYFAVSNSVVWGKRLEIAYLTPFILPLLAQNLTGDHDNGAMDFTFAFTLPFSVKMYGTYFADEIRVSEDLFSDPAITIALQGGIKWVLPGLPFTMALFQYTKIEPYTYTHYAQDYSFFDSSYYYNINWMNDGENLGYYLPPNSDEFLFKVHTMPYRGISAFISYKYIRHGEGNFEEGEMEGDLYSGGDGEEPAHAYNSYDDKDFLNDGVYEKIHVATLGIAYEMDILPLTFEFDYSFARADNYDNIDGNLRIKNILGLKIHIFPEN